ncbi:hypothetical protein K438DRAFT_2006976 [Mycena galopus ATCC 62051]|nr:hypothetical protein K438DRAFT_2006976 [Mycena galopus ATCC 62051]
METNYFRTEDMDMFAVPFNTWLDLHNFNCEPSDCDSPPASSSAPPHCWWLSQDVNCSYIETAFYDFEPLPPVDPVFSERLPSISELAGSPDTVAPPSYNTYTITPADIPPELWLAESFRMDEDIPQRAPRKPNPYPCFDKPRLFAPQMKRMLKHSSGGTRRRQVRSGDVKIVPIAPPLQVSAEEAENIRKLQRESDVYRRRFADSHDLSTPCRPERELHFRYPSPEPFTRPSSSLSGFSVDHGGDSRSDFDDAVSDTSESSDSSTSSSWSSYSTSSSSARRLSPPPQSQRPSDAHTSASAPPQSHTASNAG